MFEWLEKELAEIRTPGFHVVDGGMDGTIAAAVRSASSDIPSSYKAFVLRFGNAKLYKSLRAESFKVGVFAAPMTGVLADGSIVYYLGFHDGATVYAKPMNGTVEPSIFETEAGVDECVSETFVEWLHDSCAAARNSYGKSKWSEIVRGPKPFDQREQTIIDVRKQIKWTVIGLDTDLNHIISVSNESKQVLPVLTVGVRSKDRRLNGAVLLKIDGVGPGQVSILHVDCYKDLVPADGIELFDTPDPTPATREQFDELREV